MQTPRRPHHDAALRLLRYLKGSLGKGILLSSNSTLHVNAFCNADWASCPTNRRSTAGYIVHSLALAPYHWKTKKAVVEK